MFIEGYNLDDIAKYIIIFIVLGMLTICRNLLLVGNEQNNPFKRASIELEPKERWGGYAALLFGTIALMLLIAPSSSFRLDILIAIGFSVIMSFFILLTLNSLLGNMKEGKLSVRFLVNQNLLLVIYLIVFTELSFLNWLKEVSTYFQNQFLAFIVLYSILLVMVGSYLGIPKQGGEKREIPHNWRLRLLVVLDPLIVSIVTAVVALIIVDIILLVQ